MVVVDLFGKRENRTFVGDKFAYYVWKTTGTGRVVDGPMFCLANIEQTGKPAFYRHTDPTLLRCLVVCPLRLSTRRRYGAAVRRRFR